MRKIEFNELKLKDINDEEAFYQAYLKNIQDNMNIKNSTISAEKQFEIIYLNILGGKLILLEKKYVVGKDSSNAELFYDYSIALKVYNLMLDIEEGIKDEQNEFNELYKEERLKKSEEIENLKKQDEILFEKRMIEDSIMGYGSSKIEKAIEELKIENEKLKEIIKKMK